VPGHPDYLVSDLGRVMSLVSNRNLNPYLANGYLQVKLGSRFRDNVNRLVLLCFRGPAKPGQVCRHLDGNRVNNRLNNLAWGTLVENYNDRRNHGTSNEGERHPHAKLTEEKVREIRCSDELSASLAHRFGVTRDHVTRLRSGIGWEHVS
jgi:hypothetical protein